EPRRFVTFLINTCPLWLALCKNYLMLTIGRISFYTPFLGWSLDREREAHSDSRQAAGNKPCCNRQRTAQRDPPHPHRRDVAERNCQRHATARLTPSHPPGVGRPLPDHLHHRSEGA